MRITWTPAGSGWADCTLEDHQAKAELTASYITSAPEEFLTAVARLVAGETEARAQFEAEPTAYRWIFCREGADTWIRVLELRHGGDHDNEGTEIWSSQLGIDQLARTVILGRLVARSHSRTPLALLVHPGTPAPRHPGTPAPRHPGTPEQQRRKRGTWSAPASWPPAPAPAKNRPHPLSRWNERLAQLPPG
ncbi:hypothetical protein [Streptomyces sp. NPDC092370]|uniref:hypothetical protein n=1 Tax=Streptomyces sp. NPDC092370 TaxID=3366016 RepID=UPI00382EAAC9